MRCIEKSSLMVKLSMQSVKLFCRPLGVSLVVAGLKSQPVHVPTDQRQVDRNEWNNKRNRSKSLMMHLPVERANLGQETSQFRLFHPQSFIMILAIFLNNSINHKKVEAAVTPHMGANLAR